MKSLIVGLGIGKMYQEVLSRMGSSTTTVDTNVDTNPTYLSLEQALDNTTYDTVHISTPNYTHYSIARQCGYNGAKIVFIDKPGVFASQQWESLTTEFPNTRFMMVKNNQYRDNITELQHAFDKSKHITFLWENHNRVPNPGSWFTDKSKAYGGVSKDLLPHLLSLFIRLDPTYMYYSWNDPIVYQNWKLEDLTNTEYGKVNINGIYDVDDRVELTALKYKKIKFVADWRSQTGNKIGIQMDNKFYPLGLCPETAYQAMFETAIKNIDNQEYWQEQKAQDMFIMDKTQ